MTQQELDAIKALADAATPERWEVRRVWPDDDSAIIVIEPTTGNLPPAAQLAAYLDAARAAVPALIAEVERLRDELEDYADAIAHERRRRER